MSNITKGIVESIQIATEELQKIAKDTGVLLVFFGACLIYPVLYGFIYKNETYSELPIAVVNQSPSILSRDLIRKMDGTPELNVRYRVPEMQEAERLFAQGKVLGVVCVPNSFTSDLEAGLQTHVQGYCNMASMMYYRCFYAGFNYACLEVNKNIKISKQISVGMTQRQAETLSEPVLSQGHALYNPTSGFASFLIPAVLVLLLQQTLVLGVGMMAGTAREENPEHHLIPKNRKYHKVQRVIWGKAMAYLLIYTFLSVYDLVLMPYLFKLPHLLSVETLVAFLIPYLLASVFFSMACSVFFWNRETPLLLYLCTSVPLIFISGLSWPGTHIHPFWQYLSYLFPSTFGINGFVQLNTMGASVSQAAPALMALWVQAGLYFLFTFFGYKILIGRSERKALSKLVATDLHGGQDVSVEPI